jgi:hypothetical protein
MKYAESLKETKGEANFGIKKGASPFSPRIVKLRG